MNYPIHPDYCPPPGDTLKETIEELNISQKELALRTGLTAKTISQLINSKAPITPNIADKLELVTGVPCIFWLNLENNYRLFLKEQEEQEEKNLSQAREFVSRFPYAELVKRGACPKTQNAAEKKNALLRFLGVSDPEAYQNTYLVPMEGAARVGFSKTWDAHAFSAWLRLAELQAQKITASPFSKERLLTAIQELRQLAYTDFGSFWPRVESICAAAGVAAVIVPEFKNTHIFGFSRFIEPEKAMLVLSLRGKRVGSFLFNLFHELCHLLKHGKRKSFYNFDDATHSKAAAAALDREEAEADEFSRNILIPKDNWEAFTAVENYSPTCIKALARNLGIPSDVVLGRLQKEKRIPYANPIYHSCTQRIIHGNG